jgi:hypothetical protein
VPRYNKAQEVLSEATNAPQDYVHSACDFVFFRVKPMANSTDKQDRWKIIVGALTSESRIFVPADEALHGKLINIFHQHPVSGHFGTLNTAELVYRDFY